MILEEAAMRKKQRLAATRFRKLPIVAGASTTVHRLSRPPTVTFFITVTAKGMIWWYNMRDLESFSSFGEDLHKIPQNWISCKQTNQTDHTTSLVSLTYLNGWPMMFAQIFIVPSGWNLLIPMQVDFFFFRFRRVSITIWLLKIERLPQATARPCAN